MQLTRRGLMAGLAAGSLGLAAPRVARASHFELRLSRGLYRPPGFPRLANDPVTEFLADAWHLDGSAYDVNQGTSGAPLWGFSVRGYPYRTQFAAFSPQVTTAGQGCGFDGSSQYIYTTVGAGRGPWAGSPGLQTFLVVGRVNAQQSAAQTLMGIQAHSLGRRASLQIAPNSMNFAVNWVTNTTTAGSFSPSATIGRIICGCHDTELWHRRRQPVFRNRQEHGCGISESRYASGYEANFGNSVASAESIKIIT